MNLKNLKVSKSNILGVLLGVAAGMGHATSLRFFGVLGISELLFLLIVVYLFYRTPRFFLKKINLYEHYIRSYLLFSAIIVLPLVTILVYIFSIKGPIGQPVYIFSFIFSFLFMFLVVESMRARLINFQLATLVFLIVFTAFNIYAFFFEVNITGTHRYSGFSNNPNQLLIYIVSLMLLLVIFRRKLFFFSLPFIVYVGFQTRSDTFLVLIAAIIFSYFFLTIFNFIKIKFAYRLGLMIISLITLICLLFYNFYDELISFLKSADINMGRIKLIYNALIVTSQSPVFGWGAGSFSGGFSTFEGIEAHNTPLDLSMQFGILVPVILYCIILMALIKSIKTKNHLLSSMIIGFIICGFFNFYARHFVFWLVIGILFGYLLKSLRVYKESFKMELI